MLKSQWPKTTKTDVALNTRGKFVTDRDEHLFKKMSNGSRLYKKNLGPMTSSDAEYFGREQYDDDLKNIVADQSSPAHILGKFTGDWLDDLDVAVSLACLEEYKPDQFHPDYLYTVTIQDHPGKMPMIEKMASSLGFLPGSNCKIQMQRPGCVISRHKDPWEIFVNQNDESSIRVLVTLTHWEYGQLLCYNNHFIKEWEPGTIIYSDYQNTQHFTVNASWHTRPILLITGKANADLKRMISNKEYRIFEL